MARCEVDIAAALGSRVSAKRSQPYYLDVTHPDANKGAVVDTLVAQLGIPAAEIATIGDMPNDVLMFRRSGFSIAMGNASEEVKAQGERGDRPASMDDGFAKAVERLPAEQTCRVKPPPGGRGSGCDRVQPGPRRLRGRPFDAAAAPLKTRMT